MTENRSSSPQPLPIVNATQHSMQRRSAAHDYSLPGFPEVYHPSQERLDRCAAGLLLIITPWQYRYFGKNDTISVPACKTMNCVAQAICRVRDDWWKI